MNQIFAKDIFSSFILQIFENGRSMLLVPVIAKSMGASGFGLWVQVKIAMVFLTPFLLIGLLGGVSRFLPGSSKEDIRNGMFTSSVVALMTGTSLAIFIFLFGDFIKGFLPDINANNSLISGLALLCIAEPLNSLYHEYFRSFRKMKTLLVLAFLDTIFEFLPVFWFAYKGFGIGLMIFSFACGRVFMAVIKSIVILHKTGIGDFKKDLLIRFILFGFPLVWTNVFFLVSNYLDRYLLGCFYSVKEVGIYSFAYTIGYLVVLICSPWDKVLTPTLTEHWNEGNAEEANNYFKHSLKYVLITAVPFVVFLSAVGRQVILIFSTPEFLSGLDIIPLILVTFLIFELGIFYQRIVMLTHSSFLLMKIFGIIAILSTTLNLLLIPRFSTAGAALALFITYGVLLLIFYRFARKNNSVSSFDWLLFLKCFTATVPGFILLFFNKGNLFVYIILSILLYLILIWNFKIIGKKEIVFLRSLFKYAK